MACMLTLVLLLVPLVLPCRHYSQDECSSGGQAHNLQTHLRPLEVGCAQTHCHEVRTGGI
jgi:hypothetical protein